MLTPGRAGSPARLERRRRRPRGGGEGVRSPPDAPLARVPCRRHAVRVGVPAPAAAGIQVRALGQPTGGRGGGIRSPWTASAPGRWRAAPISTVQSSPITSAPVSASRSAAAGPAREVDDQLPGTFRRSSDPIDHRRQRARRSQGIQPAGIEDLHEIGTCPRATSEPATTFARRSRERVGRGGIGVEEALEAREVLPPPAATGGVPHRRRWPRSPARRRSR